MEDNKATAGIIARWIICVPMGLAIGILGGWLVDRLWALDWVDWYEDSIVGLLIDFFPESSTSVVTAIITFVGEVICFSIVGALSVHSASQIAPSGNKIVAGFVAGIVTVFSILSALGAIMAGRWLNAITCSFVGIAAIACLILQEYPTPFRLEDDRGTDETLAT